MTQEVSSCAQRAILMFRTHTNFNDLLMAYIEDIVGEIVNISWITNDRGVSETINVKFCDASLLRITRFKSKVGPVNLSVKEITT